MSNFDGQAGFLEITKNIEVAEFLKSCQFMHEPNDNELEKIKCYFNDLHINESEIYPNNIIAIASDHYEAKVRDDIPFTNVGYIKVSNFLLRKNKITSLENRRFLDPFEVARLQKEKEAYTFILPSSNMLYKDEKTVTDSFRLRLYEMLKSYKTDETNEETSLLATLFYLNSLKNGEDPNIITLSRCPSCKAKNVKVFNVNEKQFCKECHCILYPSDVLRLWEEINEDSASNISPLTRFDNFIKHLLLAHNIRMIKLLNSENYRTILSDSIFVINGSLAIYGTPASFYSSMQKFIYDINKDLEDHGFNRLMIIGIVESSSVLSYANFLNKHLLNSTICCVSDEFRAKYIDYHKIESGTTFGNETFYGQDFIYKNSKGKIKVFQIPYPYRDKSNLQVFKNEKSNIKNYKDLDRYIKFLDDFDSDMFSNSIIPAVLSKKYSIINMQPGSDVLNLISKNLLGGV